MTNPNDLNRDPELTPSGTFNDRVPEGGPSKGQVRTRPGEPTEAAQRSIARDPETNIGIVRQVFDEVWTRGNLEVADTLFTPSYVNHDPNQPEVPPGPAGVRRTVEMWRGIFPDLAFFLDDVRASDEYVVARWSAQGTHQGQLRTIAPTRRKVYVQGITICRMDDAHVTEAWTQWDALGMMQQIGAKMEDAMVVRMRQ